MNFKNNLENMIRYASEQEEKAPKDKFKLCLTRKFEIPNFQSNNVLNVIIKNCAKIYF